MLTGLEPVEALRFARGNQMTDLSIQNEGSIFLLRALTDAGRDWIEANIPDDAQYFGGAVVVEHRYIADIAQGAIADGLVVV
jgi:hypothetical protein